MRRIGKMGDFLLSTVILTGLATSAWADPKDYTFVPVSGHVQPSTTAPIAVRLVHTPTKKAVADAIIIQARLEMPMPGYPPMVGKVLPKGADGTGVYSFVADLSMQGQWTLTLAAKVNGESGTITGTVPVMVSGGSHSGH